jgi:hypothetical protein
VNVIRLCGGLGNQLFQYAFGRAQNANGITVFYNLMWYAKEKNAHRPFQLDHFKIDVSISPFVNTTVFEKYVNVYDLKLLKKDGFNFMGYWQCPEYFKDILPELKKEIQVKEQFYTPEFLKLRKEIDNCKSLSIHVRRGDYLENVGWHVLPMIYYNLALKTIRSFKNIDKTYVFSDGMDWCKANFKDVEFVHLNDCLDFELMRHCKHNITGNSTFSWWAAELNDNPDKMVIIPKRWRESKESQAKMPVSFLTPEGWIKI